MHQYVYSVADKQLVFDLLQLPNVGRATVRKIIQYLVISGTQSTVFWSKVERILQHSGVAEHQAQAVMLGCSERRSQQNARVTQAELTARGIQVIAWWEPTYPKLLRECSDYPLLLFVRGAIELLVEDMVAVVGTRKMTPYGAFATQKLTAELVSQGQVIVSGGMYGVDLCAHQVALQRAGRTVVVLGYGFNHIYPERLCQQYEQMPLERTCFVTEYFPETPPSKSTFVIRNSIVAGMAQAVLVTEAALRSGTHTTCQFALDEGRAVFAVPGPITSPYSAGTQWLLNQGATFVASGFELLEELRGVPLSTVDEPASDVKIDWTVITNALTTLGLTTEEIILSKLVVETLLGWPQSTQQLMAGIPTTTSRSLSQLLTKLDLAGLIEQKNGLWSVVISPDR